MAAGLMARIAEMESEVERMKARLVEASDLLDCFVAEFVREFFGTDKARWDSGDLSPEGDEFVSNAGDEALWRLAAILDQK
jgi:hypothetical protein